MEQPTRPEKIQLIAVLRVLGISQEEVAEILHVAKPIVVKTERWLRTEDYQIVRNILDDKVLKATIDRELPDLLEGRPKLLIKARHVDQATVLVHYGRKAPEDDLEENLKRHKEDLTKAARKVLNKLNTYVVWDNSMLIDEINLENNDLETIGFFQDELVAGLFAHLKHDLSELAPFSRWEDLRVKDITFQLIKKISMKAARREFDGKCPACPIQMQK